VAVKVGYTMKLCKTNLFAIAVAPFAFVALGSAPQEAPQGKLPDSLFSQAKEEDFLGSAACETCHAEASLSFARSPHAAYSNNPKQSYDKQGCESCHGPGSFHLDEDNPRNISFRTESAAETSATCLRCHESVMGKPHWAQTEHARADVSCVGCHRIHIPENDSLQNRAKAFPGVDLAVRQQTVAQKEPSLLLKADERTLCGSCHRQEAAQFRLNSHHPVPEGRMVCSDCHSVHPTRATGRKVEPAKPNCVSCHGQHSGPFVYEHDAVNQWAGDGCGECHRSHGTSNPRLLKSFSRGLCAQCHTDKAATHYPGRTCWQAGCHVALHGSNSDPYFLSR